MPPYGIYDTDKVWDMDEISHTIVPNREDFKNDYLKGYENINNLETHKRDDLK